MSAEARSGQSAWFRRDLDSSRSSQMQRRASQIPDTGVELLRDDIPADRPASPGHQNTEPGYAAAAGGRWARIWAPRTRGAKSMVGKPPRGAHRYGRRRRVHDRSSLPGQKKYCQTKADGRANRNPGRGMVEP
jgi:hypothetical protein